MELLRFFKINKSLLNQIEVLEKSLSIAEGEIKILREWKNQTLSERDYFQNIVLTRFGVVKAATQVTAESNIKPAIMNENWKSIKTRLEKMHVNPAAKEAQEHWTAKIDEQENNGRGK